MAEKRIVGIIPCRMGSTRFPGKPLAAILGRPMVEHVYKRAARSTALSRVLVATDSEEIKDAVEAFSGEAVMTKPDHPSGTDRVAEAAEGIDADIIVNIQGDEPALAPEIIGQAVGPLLDDNAIVMSTLVRRITDPDELIDDRLAKVALAANGDALYFSRGPVPFSRGGAGSIDLQTTPCYRHIGLYVFRRDFLFTFTTLPPSHLELVEGLEMLRALENGYPIRTVLTTNDSHGVDTPEDIPKVEAILKTRGDSL
ncbi:3-deoxy-manno-octulosonate cytidylyltransferase [candidate division KSB1 bacterium]